MPNQNNKPPYGGQPYGQAPQQGYGHQGQAQPGAQPGQYQQPQGQYQQPQGQYQQPQGQYQQAQGQFQQPQYGQQQYDQQQAQYGQAQGQYGQAQAPQQYGQAQAPQEYGQQAQQQYGQQAQQQYGQQAQQQYGQQAQQQYGQQAQQQYGQAQYQQTPPAQQYSAPQGRGMHAPQHGRSIPHADATSGTPARVRFIRLTYLHLTGAIFLFAGLSWLLLNNTTIAKNVSAPIFRFATGGRWNWGVFLALFVAVGYVADSWAQKRGSKALQYAGLGLYVIAEAIIFMPLLAIAEMKGAEIMSKGGGDPHFIRDAAYITIGLFAALTASVFVTKKDFSFMRSGLSMFAVGATILVFLSLAGGFNLGIVFSFAMVALAGGYVLYYTSQILAHYDTESYVAASLALFSAVALMFWYVIRILMDRR